MKLTNIFIWTILLSGLLSCEKKDNPIIEVFPDSNQLVLFQVEQTNHAWGYIHNGILIDSSGNVGYFNLPKNWHPIDTSGYLSESDMNDNLNMIDTFFITLDKNSLLKNFSLVQYAAEGEISKPSQTGADMGETVYSAFQYDQAGRKYKHVLINETGDWSRINKSPEANKIFSWLQSTYYTVQKKAHEQ
jgi:hypothetical protein